MKKQDNVILRRIGITLGLVLLLGCFLSWSLSSYIESPGTAAGLQSFVKIKGHPDRYRGSFMLTPMTVQRTHPTTYLYAKMVPCMPIESTEDVTGGQNSATYDRIQKFCMDNSVNGIIAVAYSAAHQKVTRRYLGIYVLQVQPNSKFKHGIHAGDTITRIDGHHSNTAQGFRKYIGAKKVGTPLVVTCTRDGKIRTITRPFVKITSTSKPGIGVILTNNMQVKTEVPVKVDAGQCGGPSGDLMSSLQIYQQISGKDLQRERKIAGTGTVNSDGTVEEIGGIDKKVVAVYRTGAIIFFTPHIKPTKEILKYEEGHPTNYQMAKKTAERYAPGIKAVPVTSFDEAAKYLQTHRQIEKQEAK